MDQPLNSSLVDQTQSLVDLSIARRKKGCLYGGCELIVLFLFSFRAFFLKKKLDGPSHGEAVLLPLYGAFHIRY